MQFILEFLKSFGFYIQYLVVVLASEIFYWKTLIFLSQLPFDSRAELIIFLLVETT
jgi:hypothetical protein